MDWWDKGIGKMDAVMKLDDKGIILEKSRNDKADADTKGRFIVARIQDWQQYIDIDQVNRLCKELGGRASSINLEKRFMLIIFKNKKQRDRALDAVNKVRAAEASSAKVNE